MDAVLESLLLFLHLLSVRFRASACSLVSLPGAALVNSRVARMAEHQELYALFGSEVGQRS